MNTSMFSSFLGWLRIIGFIEGLSLLILLFIAMPLKYAAGLPEPVFVVGMAHGFLFLTYVVFVIVTALSENWKLLRTFLALAMSIIPFGMIYADKKLFKESTPSSEVIKD